MQLSFFYVILLFSKTNVSKFCNRINATEHQTHVKIDVYKEMIDFGNIH